jgi:hypothetical protein
MLTILEFRVVGVEPTCFDRLPTDDEVADWVAGLPNHPLHRSEGQAVLTEIVGRGERPAPSWVRPLRRRLQYLHAKEAVRTAAPHTSARIAGAHRRLHDARSR